MRELEFTKNGSRFESEFESEGKEVFQINRSERGHFDVYAKIGGGVNPYVSVFSEPTVGERQNLLFTLDIPAGLSVKIVSYTEVASAYAESVD